MRFRRRGAWWRVGITAVCMLSAAPASATASGWLTAETPPAAGGTNAVAGMSPAGTPVIAWTTAGSPNEVELAVRAPGGAYATQVAADAPSTTYSISGVAIDDAGDLAVTWSAGGQVFLATEAAGSSSFTVRTGPSGTALGTGAALAVRILPDGTALAAGLFGSAADAFAGSVSGDGALSKTTLSAGGDTPAGPVALVANGEQAAVAFTALHNLGGGAFDNRVYLSRFTAGAYATPTAVDPGVQLLQGSAAIVAAVDDASIAADGTVDIVSVGTYGNTNGQGHSYLRATYVPPTGSASVTPLDTVDVSTGYVADQITSATVSEQGPGGAAALWAVEPGGSSTLTASGAVRAAGATSYGAATPVAGPLSTLAVLGSAPISDGAASLALVSASEIDSLAATGGGFGTPAPRLSLAAGAQIGVVPSGPARSDSGSGSTALAVVETLGVDDAVPGLILFDGTPPSLGLTVPSTGVAGHAIAVTASVSDRIDGAPAATLNFGDGFTSPASTTSHTYATAGTYTLTLAASDASANASTPITRQITITKPSPGGGGGGGGGGGSGTLKLTKVRLHPSTVTATKRRTTLSFTVSAPATVRAVLGHKSCHRHHKCAIKRLRSYSHAAKKAGPGSLTISVPRRLAPGRYLLAVTAHSGHTTTRAKTLRLRVTG